MSERGSLGDMPKMTVKDVLAFEGQLARDLVETVERLERAEAENARLRAENTKLKAAVRLSKFWTGPREGYDDDEQQEVKHD